jgi:hypothetical protein
MVRPVEFVVSYCKLGLEVDTDIGRFHLSIPKSSRLREAKEVKVGGVVSSKMTVTVKLAVPVLPAASVAVHVTVVVPTENVTGPFR